MVTLRVTVGLSAIRSERLLRLTQSIYRTRTGLRFATSVGRWQMVTLRVTVGLSAIGTELL